MGFCWRLYEITRQCWIPCIIHSQWKPGGGGGGGGGQKGGIISQEHRIMFITMCYIFAV